MMMEAELERYHTDPEWRAAYEAALATADEAGVSGEPMKVVQWAFGTANALVDGRAEAAAQRERDLEATRQRIAAHEAQQAAQAEAAPDDAQGALARAVAALNSGRGGTPTATETAADTRADRGDRATDAGSDEGQASAVQAAIKKATASINARR